MSVLRLRTDVPHAARIYDYLLGGKDNFESDRRAAAAIVAGAPHLPTSMRANRAFMVRVARHLAAERGIRQFLDIGTGLPTSPNLHEVVQAVAPESRVVYVDNDPIVLVQARALLAGTPQGATAYVEADLRDVSTILSARELTATFDLERPVAVSLIAVLQFIVDDVEVHRIVDGLLAPLCPGSVLAVSTVTAHNEESLRTARTYEANGIPVRPRTRAEVVGLFRGVTLVDPGVVLVSHWHPDDAAEAVDDAHVMMLGGIAVKP
jgi:hypothetical protein